MEFVSSRWWPLLALVSCLVPQAARPAPDASAASADGRTWLARINAAASAGNYQGTMVFSAGGTMSSTRVWHYAVGDQTYEHLEALDGRQQRIVRHNESVQTLWPQSHVAVVETRQALAGWSTTPQDVDPRALEQYEFRAEGSGRVAGREAAVLLLEPRDLLRYAQRLWADQATGLMLRADVLGQATAAGAARPVLESTAYSEIAVGVRPQPDAVLQAMLNARKPDGYRILRPQQQRTSLEAEGWALARPVAGFRLGGCVLRGMQTAGAEEPVLQAVFTDGLTHVSLFVEPFKPEHHHGGMLAQFGATGTLTQRHGDYWITAVGDVPAATLRLFAEAFDRRRP
jgi:sigma-E factor negative regulatory protein RseB